MLCVLVAEGAARTGLQIYERCKFMIHLQDQVRAFFAWSETLDYLVTRPLSHIAGNWELTWDHASNEYEPEEGSFAALVNRMIDEIAVTTPPARYHDNEDRLAEYVIASMNWPIHKVGNRWIGEDYESILEAGAFNDVDQVELLNAATGRVHAALSRSQTHFDEMEESHRRMLACVMVITLYHRGNDIGDQLD
jgi:hypothetical protein